MDPMRPAYRVLLHRDALTRAETYLRELRTGAAMGARLRQVLGTVRLESLSVEEFLESLVATKPPQIFAESAVCGDGSDWNQTELRILGDVVVAVPGVAFDNGLHRKPDVHPTPVPATLLYVPGALLANGRGQPAVDAAEVTRNGEIHPAGYVELYERRLMPALAYAHETSGARGRRALVTIPGLGCGQFAGRFRGRLGAILDVTLQDLLRRHARELGHVEAVYFDPYDECSNHRATFQSVKYLVRPLTQGNLAKPQLCAPSVYAENGDDFSNCDLYSVVAWDHVSWPGNDFYVGARATDDGVKAAATDSMMVLTGVNGTYDPRSYQYRPPPPFKTWAEVVTDRNLRIVVAGNLVTFPPS